MNHAAPTLLALDTSIETMSIAIAGAAGERCWSGPGGAQASAALLPQAQALLASLDLGWRDLDVIGFGAGPGAFTGLRTACAVAQGLALGLGCPVMALDSLALVAEGTPAGPDPVWVAMDARMDEVYAGEYLKRDGQWAALRAPALYTLPALASIWATAPPRRVAGSALAAFGARLPLGQAVVHADDGARAMALLRLARARHAAGAMIDPALALPLYLRDKVAQTTAERERARATS